MDKTKATTQATGLPRLLTQLGCLHWRLESSAALSGFDGGAPLACESTRKKTSAPCEISVAHPSPLPNSDYSEGWLAEELCEGKRAVASGWDQVVLAVGRLQDGVDAGVGRMRRNRERRTWKVPVHRQPDVIEYLDRWLEHQEVQASRWL